MIPDDWRDVVHAAVIAECDRRAAQLEQACEAAVQGGRHGVILDADGRAAVSPDVPYGQVHRQPRRI